MTSEYDEDCMIQKMYQKFQVILFAAKSVFFLSLGAAVLIIALKF